MTVHFVQCQYWAVTIRCSTGHKLLKQDFTILVMEAIVLRMKIVSAGQSRRPTCTTLLHDDGVSGREANVDVLVLVLSPAPWLCETTD